MPNQYTIQNIEQKPEFQEIFREMRAFGYWYPKKEEIAASALLMGIPKMVVARDMRVSMTFVRRVAKKVKRLSNDRLHTGVLRIL